MGDEKKPFVTYRGDNDRTEVGWSIYVGGVRIPTRFFDADGNHGAAVEQAAELVRAAVEAREAQLREPLRALLSAIDNTPFIASARRGKSTFQRAFIDAYEALKGDAPEYVSGHVACGLVWDLGAVKAKLEGAWGVLRDACLERGGQDMLAMLVIGEKLGLLDASRALSVMTDQQLVDEVKRRNLTPTLYPRALTSADLPRTDPRR